MPSEPCAPPAAPLLAAGAQRLIALVMERPPTLGRGRLLCIDGPSGAGKTTLATKVTALAPAAVIVHTDEMLEGWSGLPGLAASMHALLAPLAEGRPGMWRRWDWHTSAWAERHQVRPGGLLVLEGVGCWSPAIAAWVGALGWLEAPRDVRRSRGLARDGDDFAPHWDRWAADEEALFARHSTREQADLVVRT